MCAGVIVRAYESTVLATIGGITRIYGASVRIVAIPRCALATKSRRAGVDGAGVGVFAVAGAGDATCCGAAAVYGALVVVVARSSDVGKHTPSLGRNALVICALVAVVAHK